MPKVGKNRTLSRVARRTATLDPLPLPNKEGAAPLASRKEEKDKDEDNADAGQALSRGQRKRLAKREHFLKKEKLILSTLKLKKQEEQKRRIDGLDAIRDALMDVSKETKEKNEEEDDDDDEIYHPTFGSNRAKKGLVAREIERMNLVQQHPAFQENPFAAIQEHLKNTLGEQAKKVDIQAKKRVEEKKRLKEQKKQEKKERLRGIKTSTKKYKPRRCK